MPIYVFIKYSVNYPRCQFIKQFDDQCGTWISWNISILSHFIFTQAASHPLCGNHGFKSLLIPFWIDRSGSELANSGPIHDPPGIDQSLGLTLWFLHWIGQSRLESVWISQSRIGISQDQLRSHVFKPWWQHLTGKHRGSKNWDHKEKKVCSGTANINRFVLYGLWKGYFHLSIGVGYFSWVSSSLVVEGDLSVVD